MSTTTNNFSITLPEGTDTFNPLTFNNDAFTLVDSLIRNTKNDTVGTANHTLSENTNYLTRSDSNTNTFTFIASSDYEATQVTRVDGVSVVLRYSDGSAPGSNAYRTNQAVLCYLNGNILTLFINNVTERSYIGMIIHSRTLATEEQVKAFYGGSSWAKIEGKFLLGDAAAYPVGTNGGADTHTLSVNELPSHSHTLYGSPNSGAYNAVSVNASLVGNTKFAASGAVGYTGLGTPHNNMPPYRVVYIWERIG